MVDTNRNTTALKTPRFDDNASAKAQPVTPIPASRVAIFFESAARLFTNGSRSVALIVALGVATGALVGMALVREPESRFAGALDQASVLPDEGRPSRMEWQNAEVGVYGIQHLATTIRRSGIRRSRAQTDGQPRAYRFAVIR
jgi:hypothetical protein